MLIMLKCIVKLRENVLEIKIESLELYMTIDFLCFFKKITSGE